jgi:hypothetical protein
MRVLKNPGLYVVFMGCWIIPFFIAALISYPMTEHVYSYIPFFIAFLVLGTSGYVLGSLNSRFDFWTRYGMWKRCCVLVGMYTLAVGLILVLVVTLDSYRLVTYFGGDAGGSFGLLLLPSIIIYLALGGVFATITTIIKRVKAHRTDRSP